MELFILYLWLKLNAIGVLFLVVSCICLAGIILLFLCSIDEVGDRFWKKWKPTLNKVFYIGIFSVLIYTFLPSKTDTAILVGAHYALKVAETPEAAKVMTLLRQKANDLLDEELNKSTKKEENK